MSVATRMTALGVNLAVLAAMSMGMSQIKRDEVVVFYPTCAHLDSQGKTWIVPIHGVIFEPEGNSLKRTLLVEGIRRQLDVESGTPEAEVFDRRARLFLVDHERGKEISIRLSSRTYRVGKSGANGHFAANVRLSVAEANRLLGDRPTDGSWGSFQAITRAGDDRQFEGRFQCVGNSGLSVVSDIDDTIKDSQVTDRRVLLRNTFLKDFKPVSGMADAYGRAAERGVVFHYVSASPWQLYGPLAEFCRREGFPPGSFHLKHVRPTDSSALSLLGSQEATKLRAIEPILATFPGRRFILIGDSGEQDPEIFGKVAREHPDQIAAICIRNVTDEAAQSDRFRAAFQGIAPGLWMLFRQPTECESRMRELLRARR